MSPDDISLCVFLLIGAIWLSALVQGHRLFYRFRAKYPDVAKKEIPYAFDWRRHPEKLFYFFRRKSQDLLRNDAALWPLRQQVKILLILSGLIPFVAFFGLMAFAIFLSHAR